MRLVVISQALIMDEYHAVPSSQSDVNCRYHHSCWNDPEVGRTRAGHHLRPLSLWGSMGRTACHPVLL